MFVSKQRNRRIGSNYCISPVLSLLIIIWMCMGTQAAHSTSNRTSRTTTTSSAPPTTEEDLDQLMTERSQDPKRIPDFLHVCKRTDPDLVDCIQNTIEELKPYLRKGIPEMNVPPLEPLLIKQLIAAQGSGLKITTEDLKVYGCSNFTIRKLTVNLKEHKFFFSLDLPHLVLDGRYVVDGRVILIPVKGNGPLTGDIYKAKANVTLAGELVKKSGEDYIHYTSMNIRFKVGSGRLKLDNLFGGERVLGEIINTAINLNFDQFIGELRPIIEGVLAKFMLESANSIVEGFPYRVLFPEE